MGDEAHSLTTCVRAAAKRETVKTEMRVICRSAGLDCEEADIMQMMGMISTMKFGAQQKMWKLLGTLAASVDEELAAEGAES